MNFLVISHAANRSGAPLSLLCFVRWLNAQGDDGARVYALRSGPLESEFPVQTDRSLRVLRRASLLESLRKRAPQTRLFAAVFSGLQKLNARLGRRALARYLRDHKIEAVLANSVAAGAALQVLAPLLGRRKIGVVVWVHELAAARAQFAGDWRFCQKHGDTFCAASRAVRDELLKEGLASEKIAVVHEMIDFARLETDKSAARRQLREQLGLDENAFVVGACGTPEARKGFDWWPRIAAFAPNCALVWLGGDAQTHAQARREAQSLGAEIYCLPPTRQPQQFFAGLDAFCLPSREDPFPLVALEAASQGVPVVCFKGAGGAPELVSTTAGICVEWGDLEAMANALELLRQDAVLRTELGLGAARRARELGDVKGNGPLLAQILRESAAGKTDVFN